MHHTNTTLRLKADIHTAEWGEQLIKAQISGLGTKCKKIYPIELLTYYNLCYKLRKFFAMELLSSEQLTHFCVCVQREQPGGMRSGAVFRTGHGDPWEGFLSRAERWRRERARHRRKQGGVHQVKERNGSKRSEQWEIMM